MNSDRPQPGLPPAQAAPAVQPLSRREFVHRSAWLLAAAALPGCQAPTASGDREPIIDIHQHVGYSGRPDDLLFTHQQAMGVTQTVLLPAGRPMNSESTHKGVSNGLQAKALGNEACVRFAQAHPGRFYFAANEVPDAPDAVAVIEKYLKQGGVMIAEQKFGLECDAAPMQRLYQLAADHQVPILMHWQHGMYNYGFERFYKMLEKHPRTLFIGHAQTWWANVDKNHTDQSLLYPKGKVAAGGLTDRYLSDYPNLFGDLSAGSGLNAFLRDEEQAREFMRRHQDKLVYGSDCNDRVGTGSACQGAQMIAAVRRLAPTREIERKLLYGNARRILRLG